MKSRFTQDASSLSPSTRHLALAVARTVCWTAPVMGVVLAGVGLAHFLFEVGNYPEPRARFTVGLLLLLVFVPATALIWYLARRRVQVLTAFEQAEKKSA